jgi:membrane-associated phospholipid phosphatase
MNSNSSKTSDMHKLICDNKDFIIPFIVYMAFICVPLGIMGNDALFLYLNNYNSKFADFIFLNITNMGDAIVAVILIIVLLLVSFRESLTFLTITLLLAIVVTVLKDYIFPELDRPVAYFGPSKVLRLVAGYHPPMLSTFPSGHTATAFSVGLYLAILSKNRFIKLSLFFIASIVSYSRIYLSAHFPADLAVGASLAVLITILCYYLSRRVKNSWIDRKIVFKEKIFVIDQTT